MESVNISLFKCLILDIIEVIVNGILFHSFQTENTAMAFLPSSLLDFLRLFYSKTEPRLTLPKLLIACFFSLCFSTVFAQDDPSAQIEHAKEFYFAGDYASAAKGFEPLAGNGDAEALYYLGLIYKSDSFPQRDINKAASYLLSAADQNHHSAMWQLGQMYENGEGVQRDVLVATDWYRKSEQSSPPSESGIQFFKTKNGTLVNQSPAQAIGNLKRAAESGDVESLYQLGKVYDLGVLTQRDESEAFKWYLKAATNGHEYSAFMVGYFYCRGIGVAADQTKANEWLGKSTRDAKCK